LTELHIFFLVPVDEVARWDLRWLWLKRIARWDFRLTELHTFYSVLVKGDHQMGSQVNEKKEKKNREKEKERKKRKKRKKIEGKEKETEREKGL
jgi:hypothetical protein